jgi:disulfide bond formation protein DsbB
MFNKKKNISLIFLLFIILSALIAAYTIEYSFGHKPCKLCVYERIPYFISIFFIIEILFFKKHEKVTLLILSLIFIMSFALAFYHFGIEQGFFSESFLCEDQSLKKNLSKKELLEKLKQNTINCKDVSFRILGFSLASINSILSLILSFIFIKLFLNYGKN